MCELEEMIGTALASELENTGHGSPPRCPARHPLPASRIGQVGDIGSGAAHDQRVGVELTLAGDRVDVPVGEEAALAANHPN
jgi:hypothetical protein